MVYGDSDFAQQNLSSFLLSEAGAELQTACKNLGPLNIGEIKETDGFGLPCRKVLHYNLPRCEDVLSAYRVSVLLACHVMSYTM